MSISARSDNESEPEYNLEMKYGLFVSIEYRETKSKISFSFVFTSDVVSFIISHSPTSLSNSTYWLRLSVSSWEEVYHFITCRNDLTILNLTIHLLV